MKARIDERIPDRGWIEQVLRKEHLLQISVSRGKGWRSVAMGYCGFQITLGPKWWTEGAGGQAWEYRNIARYMGKHEIDPCDYSVVRWAFLHELGHIINARQHGRRLLSSHGKEYKRILLGLVKRHLLGAQGNGSPPRDK